MIKVGIIGSGRIGKTHTKTLSMLSNVELYAIADPVATDLEDYAKSINIRR